MKNSSKLAWAYLNSEFFAKSLEVCNTFKLVTDVTRFNEEGGQEAQWNAGPRFIKKFMDQTKDLPNIEKVEFMVFCRDKRAAIDKFNRAGIPQSKTPTITHDSA